MKTSFLRFIHRHNSTTGFSLWGSIKSIGLSRWLSIVFLLFISNQTTAAPLIFPLKEVKPGLKGKCHTVFSGISVDSFNFEVMGVTKNFAGPGHDIIWCRMIDDPTGQKVIAQGMSGSPCFIEDRNMGALAYGFSFNKDPVFGIQPIESMLENLEFKNQDRLIPLESHPLSESSSRTPIQAITGRLPLLPLKKTIAQPLPLPLQITGLHPLIADHVLKSLSQAGFFPQTASSGNESNLADAAEITAGSAVSAVLARGDLNMTATGTLTWRDGERFLAFGHPLLGIGAITIPLSKAEIIGVVSSYEISTKISNTGSLAGTFMQDRLSGVSGIIGPLPKLTPMAVEIQRSGSKRSYQLEFWDNKFSTPNVYQTALLQFLANVMEATEESTLSLKTEIQFEGLPALKFDDLFTGERFSWVFEAVLSSTGQMIPLYENPFGTPLIHKIAVEARVTPLIQHTVLEEINVKPLEARANDTIRIRLGFRPWHGSRFYQEHEIKLPEEIKSGEIELLAIDASHANQIIGSAADLAFATNGETGLQNLEQLIHKLNERHHNDSLYLVLQQKSPGLSIQSQRLTALPESIRKLIANDQSASTSQVLQDTIILQKKIEFQSVIEGAKSIKIKIK